ncbi:tyrosine-type recombinase/integrase [Mesorhizobium opportunistum]|uniref:Integrase family protein n=1 Tax=Mesorhizobium opportunistum (strain LMG 24607 / HAMBI 3007 / WSM2075) TaxID=536019 RepID=F7XZT4_MESOW|nr:tyrosine-type recombinase/integrase [Mesorhizobium opportunistum]AEH88148.1 integrase family protein [Mesorhizobium opportunistum WSM2075]
MGRNRTRTDPDRYLTIRQGNYHYKRRVPVTIAHLDERAPHVRASLKTDDRTLARGKRDLLEAADDALWASLITKGVTDPARRRYEAAVKRVEALDFTFHGATYFEEPEAFNDLMDRIRHVLASGQEDRIADPLLGAVEVPDTKVSDAFDIYCNEIVADELIGKSQVQKDQWKKVKRRAINNFIKLNGDIAMEEIGIDHAKKVYRHWLGRIAPKEGSSTAGASSGNRDLGNMRVLYEAYFKYQGDARRDNPFEGLGFSLKKKRSRPPIPTEWIRDTMMKPGNLATLNDEARGILLILIETGARPSEICNLEPHAIRLSNKVPHLSIEPREDPANPREIKTESSRRLVPLVGVALAAAERHKTGFPRYRNRENELSATLNHFLRANSLLPTKAHTVYSFRHSFEDRMKEAGLDDELRRLLMGHTVDRPKYGSGGSLDWRRRELMKIALPFDQSIV